MVSPMAISPQVQGYGQTTGGPEEEERRFKEKFNSMAYAALASKFAEIMQHVVTFKILETALDESRGVGVFILDYQGNPVYIPVVLNDGMLKPLEILYYKQLNAFLPLNTAWLDEIAKMSVENIGDAAELPTGMQQNVNIRNLVIPPSTAGGREGYASADIAYEAKAMFKEAAVQTFKPVAGQFLSVLRSAPAVALDGIKIAFKRHPGFLQKCAQFYGIDALMAAFDAGYKRDQQLRAAVKEAAAAPRELHILTANAPQSQIQSVFGTKAGEAFSAMLKHGFAVSDTRNVANTAVKVERPLFLDTPGPNPAWYKLYFADAPPDEYYIVPFPKDRQVNGCCSSDDYPSRRINISYMLMSKDGKAAWTTDKVVGERIDVPTSSIKSSKIYQVLKGAAGDTPKINSYGFFINTKSKVPEVTRPSRIAAVFEDGDYKKYRAEYGDTYVVDPTPIRSNITAVNDLMFLPKDIKFIHMYDDDPTVEYEKRQAERDRRELETRRSSIINDPKMLHEWLNSVLQESNTAQPSVKTAGMNQWWLKGVSTPVSTTVALTKLALAHDISVKDAYLILEDARNLGTSTTYIMSKTACAQVKTTLDKYAAVQEGPMEYQSMPGQQGGLPPMGDPAAMSPAGGTEMDPSQMGDPMMAAQMGGMQQPPQAPPLNPTDLAIGEAVQDLQNQAQQGMMEMQSQMSNMQTQLEAQQQSTQQLVSVLQGIQQRSAELAQATGGMLPENAMSSPSISAKAIAPPPQMEEPPPPMPMMTQEGYTPETIADQINPEMAEQAGAFNEQGMFDTAAVGMLAASPILQDVVSTYVPNLEKAVDNLGRILLTLWMKEDETKEAIGEESYILLEDKLRTVFKNLGEVVLSLSKNAVNASEEAEKAQMVMQARQG